MESAKSDSLDMTAAIIPLPAYHHNAKNWFLQVESIFSMLRITSQRARFANVMQKLPSDMMDEISDVLSDLREHEPYDHLKEAILKRTGRSEEDMIQEILRNVTRGDKTPSQLLRYMRNQLGKHNVSEKVLRGLWLEHLPKSVAQIIAPMTRATPLDDLAESADLVFAQFDHSVNAVRAPDIAKHERYEPSKTERALADLQRQIRELQISLRPRTRTSTPSRRRRTPAENGEATRVFVAFIAHSAMGPGIVNLPVHTRRPGETNKPESRDD
ncbi:unnamed protein product [Acanthosepion pharaonis]|uniref:DUF7041 domain-containing protein n=1 Tax=Acanthosepion pharaonis TaxID=158019 RepID=A0A812DRF3_ACAPH|nr:unnamed protein product [Sepia pharaonis]